MEQKNKRRRYNRFLRSNENIPRSSSYRRQQVKKCSLPIFLEKSKDDSIDTCSTSSEPEDEDYGTPSNIPMCESVNDTNSSRDSSDQYSLQNSPDISENNTQLDDKLFEDKIINFDDCLKPLYPGADVTVIEAYISVLSFSQRFNLSQTCFQEFLQLLELLLPPSSSLPGTTYTFFNKMYSVYENSCEVHIYCDECQSFICKLADENKPDKCSFCEKNLCADESIKKGSFFLYMPLKQQLKVKFEKQNLLSDIKKYRSTFIYSGKELYKDILDGDYYNSLPELKNFNNISLQFNIDGIPIYRKSKYDIWPIQCSLNEIHPNERKKHIIVCGLWFGTKKPEMELFLQPFVTEIEELSTDGFQWFDSAGKVTTTKVFAILCVSDAPARAAIQNFTQFNGKFGCGFCTHEGKHIEKGNGFCRVYSPTENVSPQERTFQNTIEWGEKAIEKGSKIMGVKGISLLVKLYPHFNIIKSFVPDYMHCALLGVTRQIVKLWLDTSKYEFSLKHKSICKLDKRIVKLKIPHEVVRVLRTTSNFAFWKASELRTFLRASPVLLKNILHEHVYKHWLLFVHGISLLLESEVKADMLFSAEVTLKQFVSEISSIYGENEQSYNIHLLLHMTDAVRNWGPLWAQSCFMYEDSLGNLKTLHHGTKGVPQQILSSYLNHSILEMLISENTLSNQRVVSFIDKMMRRRNLTQKALYVDGCILFGAADAIHLLRVEELAVQKIANYTSKFPKVYSYKRVMHKEKIYSTEEYCKPFQRVDHIVNLKKVKCYVSIDKIILLNNEVFFLGKKLKVSLLKMSHKQFTNLCPNIMSVINDVDYANTLAFKPCEIVNKFGILSLKEQPDDKTYLIPLCSISEQ